MTDKQADAAKGKRRGPYQISVPRTYGGRGAMKCAVCGDPIVTHTKMELCKGKKVNDE